MRSLLSACLSVCVQGNSKCCGWIQIKVPGSIDHGPGTNHLDFEHPIHGDGDKGV